MFYSCTCKKCNNPVKLDPKGQFLECMGCGDRITDVSMVGIREYEDSMTCPNCSGQLNKDSTGDMLLCGFCGSTFITDSYFSEFERKYDRIVPFDDTVILSTSLYTFPSRNL